MRRAFEIDVLECPQCQGPMRVLAEIHPPQATRAILDCLGRPTRAPPIWPAYPESPADRYLIVAREWGSVQLQWTPDARGLRRIDG